MKRRRILEADTCLESTRAKNKFSTHCRNSKEAADNPISRRYRSQVCCRSSFEPRVLLVLVFIFAFLVISGSSFPFGGSPSFRSRQSGTEISVVEPTERTEELYTTIASDISSRVDHAAMSDSLCFTAVTAGEEDHKPESFVEGSIMEGYEDEAAKYERLAKAAKAAALLARRTSSRPSGQVTGRSTSVGARRIGSASQALTGTRSLDLLTDAVKKVAAASTTKPNKEKTDRQGPSLSRSLSDIQATVESMMQTSMGLFGEAEVEAEVGPPPANFYNRQQFPSPGTVLVHAEHSSKMWKAAERVSVRVASTADDFDIATLRLSVFSDFSADMRRAFCAKSCQVLATRRNRGATCVVATVPRYGSVMLPRPDIILGTAECSFHEFEGTTIGRRRLVDSILYITEVAVSPTARRKGIGQKLLESIDELATIRGVETLFLHVDTTNFGALSLYQQSGYSLVPASEPMYQEFTRSLNLHDGATKGRNHYLLMKDLLPPTWLPEGYMQQRESRTGTLGFDITG